MISHTLRPAASMYFLQAGTLAINVVQPVFAVVGPLQPAYSLLSMLYDAYTRVAVNKVRCGEVVERAATILKAVNEQLGTESHNWATPAVCKNVERMEVQFASVRTSLAEIASWNVLKSLIRSDEIDMAIAQAHHNLTDVCQCFVISSQIAVHEDQRANEEARKADARQLETMLAGIANRDAELLKALEIGQKQQMEAMLAMQKFLGSHIEDSVQRTLLKRGLVALQRTTGRVTPKELPSWHISMFELDIDNSSDLGEGGFGTVKRATWSGTTVAVKVMAKGTSFKSIHNEIDVWSRLRHEHILPFYGASDTADPPFIVSRFMSNGNASEYLLRNPDKDRVMLIHQVCLGMAYLHRQSIVHGDLKATNILIDEGGKACVADFGLSRIKLEAQSRSSTKFGRPSGTLRFMAPEQMLGTLIKASDVYSYGMLLYEIFTDEPPFMLIPDAVLIQLITERGKRLDAPQGDKAALNGLSSQMWDLIWDCTSPEAASRPSFDKIHRTTRQLSDEWRSHANIGKGANELALLDVDIPPPAYSEVSTELIEQTTADRPSYPRQRVVLRTLSEPALTSLVRLPAASASMKPVPWAARSDSLPAEMGRAVSNSVIPTLSSLLEEVHPGADSDRTTATPGRVVQGAGMLRVTVINASGLNSSQDLKPYVHLRVDMQEQRTRVGKGCAPVWEEVLPFTLRPPVTSMLVSVLDYRKFGPDRKMAQIQIDIRQHGRSGQPTELMLPEGAGTLLLQLQYTPAGGTSISSITSASSNEGFASSPVIAALPSASSRGSIDTVPSPRSLLLNPDMWEGIQWSSNSVLSGHSGAVQSVAISSDGECLASGSSDKSILLWTFKGNEPILPPLVGHKDRVTSLAFSPDQSLLVSGSDDKTIRLWEASNGKALRLPRMEHTKGVTSVAFSSDGQRVVSGSLDTSVRIWDTRTGNPVHHALRGHSSAVRSVVFSRDGTRIISGSSDKTISIWDAHTGKSLLPFLRGHTGGISSVAISPDGKHITSGSADKTIRIWDSHDGRLLSTFLVGNEISAVAFSDAGRSVIGGLTDGTITIWNVRSAASESRRPEGHRKAVNSVSISQDGKRLVSGSSDKTVRTWELVSQV